VSNALQKANAMLPALIESRVTLSGSFHRQHPQPEHAGGGSVPEPVRGQGHHAYRGREADACGRVHRTTAGDSKSADGQAAPRLHPHVV